MDQVNPVGETCLTAEERRDLEATWHAFQQSLAPMDAIVARVDQVDCEDLHSTFLRLVDAFDQVERAVMRSRQVRLVHAAHGGEPIP